MTWVKVTANGSVVGEPYGIPVPFVYDPAVGPSLTYRCSTEASADALVTKLNSVDYP